MKTAKEYMEEFVEKLNSGDFDKSEEAERKWLMEFAKKMYGLGVRDALDEHKKLIEELEEELTNLSS